MWGGASSVGSNAVQLAVAAGYDVITTAPPHHVDFLRQLGASQVLDRASRTVVTDAVHALAGRTIAGALAIGTGSTDACADVVHASRGTKFIATTSTPVSLQGLSRRRPGAQLPLLARLVTASAATRVRLRARGIRTKAAFGSFLMHNEVSRVLYQDFLPAALADGRHRAAPPPTVVGTGLQCLQAAMDTHQQGVSAEKIVVLL